MKPILHVTFPRQTPATAALFLRGHRMGLLRDGWLLVYEHTESPPTDALVEQLCVLKTADHRVLCRVMRKGRKGGAWDLLTGTGEQELDVAVVWAARVDLIIPHEPTPDEVEAFGSTY